MGGGGGLKSRDGEEHGHEAVQELNPRYSKECRGPGNTVQATLSSRNLNPQVQYIPSKIEPVSRSRQSLDLASLT